MGKREMVIYIVSFLWIAMGVLGSKYGMEFTQLSAYFAALTAFVATYVWGESVRQSDKTSIIKSGGNSHREMMIYFTILIWTVSAVIGIMRHMDLIKLGTYFAVLTPFIGAYILGETYKPDKTSTTPTEDKPEEPTNNK